MGRLYHYTCAHAAPLIERDGLLRPHPQILLDNTPLIWFTDLEEPDRQALGLTSLTLNCDRTAYRVVVDLEATHWPKLARQFPAGRRQLEFAPGGGLMAGLSEDLVRRFWSKVTKGDAAACWEWTGGARSGSGYGVFSVNGRMVYVHRFAYGLTGESVPDDMTIDHLCRNKACVNTAHMEIVTRGENGRRANRCRIYRQKDECKRGHRFVGENIYIDGSGQRACRTCRRDRAWDARKAAREQRLTAAGREVLAEGAGDG